MLYYNSCCTKSVKRLNGSIKICPTWESEKLCVFKSEAICAIRIDATNSTRHLTVNEVLMDGKRWKHPEVKVNVFSIGLALGKFKWLIFSKHVQTISTELYFNGLRL